MTMKMDRRRVLATVCALGCLGAAPLSAQEPTAQERPQIRIGFVGPLSGSSAMEGAGPRNAFLMAIEEANADPAYPYAVEGVVQDDAAAPRTGVAAARALVADPSILAVTGHYNSGVALTTIPVFHKAGMPLVVWGAGSPKITEQNKPGVTRVEAMFTDVNKPFAPWVLNTLGARTVAIVSDTGAYGSATAISFATAFKEAGGTVVSRDLLPEGTTEFGPSLEKIRALTPDAIYFGGGLPEGGDFLKQKAAMGLTQPVVAISGIYNDDIRDSAGDSAEGVLVGNAKSLESPALAKFAASYRAHGFAEPETHYAKYAYDATRIILAAIGTAGPQDRAAIAKAIRATSHEGALGAVSFDETGQNTLPVTLEIKVFRNGNWVDYGK